MNRKILVLVFALTASAFAGFGVRGGGKPVRIQEGEVIQCEDEETGRIASATCRHALGCDTDLLCKELEE